jgi:hypothetical protein
MVPRTPDQNGPLFALWFRPIVLIMKGLYASLASLALLLSPTALTGATPPSAIALGPQSLVGEYDCIVTSGKTQVDRFKSINTTWHSWLYVTTIDELPGNARDVSRVFVGFDPNARRWSIVGVDQAGTYWTRRSASKYFDGSRWVDNHPADGATSLVRVLGSGAQYTFDQDVPQSDGRADHSHVLCTRRRLEPRQ